MFDDVMLLGKGGRLVFLGPSTLALPYFQQIGFDLPPNENPAGAHLCRGAPAFSLWRESLEVMRSQWHGGSDASADLVPPPPHPTPDFLMDVVSGAVPRRGDAGTSAFQPSELFGTWLSQGAAWVQQNCALAAKREAPTERQAVDRLGCIPRCCCCCCTRRRGGGEGCGAGAAAGGGPRAAGGAGGAV
jgi:hypothetical protein